MQIYLYESIKKPNKLYGYSKVSVTSKVFSFLRQTHLCVCVCVCVGEREMEVAKKKGLEDEEDDSNSDNKNKKMVGEDVVAWLSSVEADDTVSELMLLLETTSGDTQYSSMNATSRVKFIDNPYSLSIIFQCSSSYITINGNEESCGSSFSDSDSSVMASVDMAGINNVLTNTLGSYVGRNWVMGCREAGGAWGSKEGGGWMVEDGLEWVGVEGDDEIDVVARFLDEDIF